MASIKLAGDTSGEITISAPSVAGTHTLTLPSLTANILTDGAGEVGATQLASTLDLSGKTVTLATDAAVVSKLSTASGSAPSYSARAWVNFNGTGAVAIRSSGNVSSITDNGTGLYTVNFSTAMPDTNYCTIGSSIGSTTSADGMIVSGTAGGSALTTGAVQVRMAYAASNGATDITYVNVSVFR
jgi:hypothetical protein